jgi:hypothetical protein
MESSYDKLVEDLHDIEKTMFALGTSPINMDNVSIRLAYDKKWGQTAKDAADAIEELQKTLKAVKKNSEINFKMWEEAQAEVERLQVDVEAAHALMEVQE